MPVDEPNPIDFYPPAAPYPSSAWPSPQHAPAAPLPPTPTPKKKKSIWVWIVPAFVVAALIGGLLSMATNRGPKSNAAVAVTASSTKTTAVPAASSTSSATLAPGTTSASAAGKLIGPPLDIHALIAKVGPSVVSIEIFQRGARVAAGSGVVVSDDGLIVTNAHVVSLTDQFGRALRNPSVKVRLADGTERDAKILGSKPDNDIALIKVDDTSGLKAAEIGDSDALEVGDDVVAIGNALDLGATPTVTKGIISAKDRSLEVDVNLTLKGLLQTDAAINHGNSGGALVNASGQVVGINSAGIPDAQNLGFAIASKTFEPLIGELKSGTAPVQAARPVLGVVTVPTADGVLVNQITPGSGAETAGIQDGDIITGVDGKAITTQDELGAAIKAHKPGDSIKVTFDRSGKTKTVSATLGSG